MKQSTPHAPAIMDQMVLSKLIADL